MERPRRHRAIGLHAAVIAGLLILSVLAWWHVWTGGHLANRITCQCGDVSEALNFLAWTPWALQHGHNPLLANTLFVGQGGVNMLDNASWIFWAALFAPITWLFGPVVTFNIVLTLAPVVAGWTFFLAVRKFTTFVPGQIAGAVFFGFSPVVMTTEPIGHFFAFWLFFPPLLFLLLYDLFVERRRRPVALGIGLGVLVVVQFFTSTETLVICAVLALAASVAAVCLAPRVALARWPRIATGLGVGAITSGVLLAYPVWFALAGPRHIVGAIWPGMGTVGTYISGLVNPHTTRLVPGIFVGPPAPNLTFIGVAMAVVILVSMPLWIRRRIGVIVFIMGAAAWLLALGTQPYGGADFPSWLRPWRLVGHIPIVSNVVPQRFALGTITAAAVLLSLSADCWWQRATAWATTGGRHTQRRNAHALTAGLIAAVAAATLIPVATSYALPFSVQSLATPAWFRGAATHLRPGTVVLTYPFPGGSSQQAEGWQALDGMRFRLAGGYDVVPGADGKDSEWIRPLGGATLLLQHMSVTAYTPLPPVDVGSEAMIHSALARWHVQDVVVTREGRDPPFALAYFTAVLGRLPRYEQGAWVWRGVAGTTSLTIDPAQFSSCLKTATTSPLSLPTCVMQHGTATHTGAGSSAQND